MTSCSKDQATVPPEEFVTDEIITYKVNLPESITTETAAEWFNKLTEEEIEEYLIEDSDEAVTRGCASWSSWSGWYVTGGFTCFSLVCPFPQSQSSSIRRRSRVRECSSGTEVETQNITTSNCRPPC
jgi:hypothetical protein